MRSTRPFYSKILLFGEYSIIRSSKALAVPYDLFEGRLMFSSGTKMIDSELKAFAKYLRHTLDEYKNEFTVDVSSFEFDIAQGLHFNSTIPQGYGVGSSGALCAAVFESYGKITGDGSLSSVSKLKKIFSLLESHFHGASSGIDPLISFLGSPILISSKEELGIVTIPKYAEGSGAIFLLNTCRARRTEPLVNLFLEKSKSVEFAQLCDRVLLPITNECINAFLQGHSGSLYEFFRELSDFQFRHMTPMIPPLYQEIWLSGIKSESYYLKLCGAGGGGFLLGITKDFKKLQEILKDQELRALYFF